jgi:hypothetical protein
MAITITSRIDYTIKQKNEKIKTLAYILLVAIGATGIISIEYASAYDQLFSVEIDKTDYYLGQYGVIVQNLDAGLSTENYYSDTSDSPFVVVNHYIPAISGDRLQACVMQMSSSAIACDYKIANSPSQYVDFFVDMHSARVP